MKVVINRCFGGFGLSPKAVEYILDHGGLEANLLHKEPANKQSSWLKAFVRDGFAYFTNEDNKLVFRSHPLVVEAVEVLGDRADGFCSKLRIVEIPDDIDWDIHYYDGLEHIEEKHRTWE